MSNFFKELKRRNVIKAAIAYLVIAWLLLQVASIIFPILNAPEWILRSLTLILAIGLPVWLVIAWFYEITPGGLEKIEDTKESEVISEITNKRLNIFIIIGLSIAVVFLTLKLTMTSKDKIDELSIAVLYFDNMSADEKNDWISDGMTESITAKLEPNKDLLVISRTSVKQFKDSEKSSPVIAKELGVSYILEGSVTRDQGKARITAQLINKNDVHVWSAEYDVELEDILTIQGTIANKIVEELKIVLSPEEKRNLKHLQTNNIEAYKLFLRGQSLADTRTTNNVQKAFQLYQQAVVLDTLYAEAYAEIGHVYYFLEGSFYKNRLETIKKMKEYSDKALSINPNVSRAYTILALRMSLIPGSLDMTKYRGYYEKALELNPNDVIAYIQLAGSYAKSDKDRSLLLIEKALRIEPLSIRVNATYIRGLANNEKLDEAEAHFIKSKYLFHDEFKNEIFIHILKAKANKISLDKKDWTQAVKIYKDALIENPENYRLYKAIGRAYDEILNDDINYIKYSKMAYKIDSTKGLNLMDYYKALLKGEKFKEAKLLMSSKNSNKVLSDLWKSFSLWLYHYNKMEYLKALDIIKDTIFSKSYQARLFNYAQIGNIEMVHQISNKSKISNSEKAFVHAIIKEKDSMYFYLNTENINFKWVNSRFEFDPYRKEERYKEFLKKNYLPITHWNE